MMATSLQNCFFHLQRFQSCFLIAAVAVADASFSSSLFLTLSLVNCFHLLVFADFFSNVITIADLFPFLYYIYS